MSAAEFTWFGGAFDPESGAKEAFSNPMMIPQVIIMDPRMTMETPMRLSLTTGMKAVDHAAKRLESHKRICFLSQQAPCQRTGAHNKGSKPMTVSSGEQMPPVNIGRFKIDRVEEFLMPGFAPDALYPDFDRSVFKEYSWLARLNGAEN